MATFESISSRFDYIQGLYDEHYDEVVKVQQDASEDLIPLLTDELELTVSGVERVKKFLDDPVTVFRFLRKSKFNPEATIQALHRTLTWRIQAHLDLLSASTLETIYTENPVFYFHPDTFDRWGRPCAVLNLRCVRRTEDNSLDSLKEFIAFGWEVGRRYLNDLAKGAGAKARIQLVMVVDLEGAGMSNLEVELLPYFMDLLKNHFPGMVACIFVLNYGWMYAGMWQLAKRILPATALERIIFPSKEDLRVYFEPQNLLTDHGGEVDYNYDSQNPIFRKYGRPTFNSPLPSPTASPTPSRPISRTSSYESMYEVFYSPSATPSSSRPTTPTGLQARPSWLSMTSMAGQPQERRGSSSTNLLQRRGSSITGLKRIGSLREFKLQLPEGRRSNGIQNGGDNDGYGYDDDGLIGSDGAQTSLDYARRIAAYHQGALPATPLGDGDSEGTNGGPGPGTISNQNSATNSITNSDATSRAGSRTGSRAVSRDPSPSRRFTEGFGERWAGAGMPPEDGEVASFSRRTRIYSGGNVIAPYNSANPFYGYPGSKDEDGNPRPFHHRRRKRDLFRTLTYLMALRFLAVHRELSSRIEYIVTFIVRFVGFSRVKAKLSLLLPGSGPSKKKRGTKGVTWAREQDGDARNGRRKSSSSQANDSWPPDGRQRGQQQQQMQKNQQPGSFLSTSKPAHLGAATKWVYLFVIFVILRSAWFDHFFLDGPSRVILNLIYGHGRGDLPRGGSEGIGQEGGGGGGAKSGFGGAGGGKRISKRMVFLAWWRGERLDVLDGIGA